MDRADVTRSIVRHLEQLADLGERAGLDTLTTEIRDERLPAVQEGRLHMVVLGEFNHGKSTVINALLGSEVLPTGITPTTAVITHIRRGDKKPRLVRDSGVDKVARDGLRQAITEDPPDDLRYVEVYADSEFLADGLVVVDTPGVNDISKQKVEITYGYVPRADVVVYVLDATQALKRSEITFIRERLLRNSLDRLFFVIGKVDALSDAEVEEIIAHVKARLSDLVGDVPIFPLSARRATQGGDPGFDTFRDAVTTYLHDQREAIVIDGALRAGLRLTSLADQSLAIEQGAMRLEAGELEKRVKNVQERLKQSRLMISDNVSLIDDRTKEIAATTRDAVRSFAHEFSTALPREVERANTDDIKRYLPDYVHDTFKDFLEGEGLQLALRLEQLAEEIIEITNRNVREALEDVQDELGVKARDIDLDVDTFGYDVGVFALGALGVTFLAFSNILVGGVLTLSAPILAFVLKDRVDATIREKATEQGLEAIAKAAVKVEDEFDRVVADFSDRLKQFVEDAGERLYRQVAEALDRALVERRSRGEEIAPVAQDLHGRREEVRAIHEALLTLREQVRMGRAPH